MATTNFNWTENTGANFEVEANTTYAEIEESLSGTTIIVVDDTNAATVTPAQFQQNAVFIVRPDDISPPSSTITLTVPTNTRGFFVVRNETLESMTVTIAGQSKTAPTVSANFSSHLNTDGVNIMEVS